VRAVQGHYVGVCSAMVAHGWNVDYSARPVWVTSTASAWNVNSGGSGRARCWVLRERVWLFLLDAGLMKLWSWTGVVWGRVRCLRTA
jgi:hypothetical protein